jgi:hypothetical protein
VQQEPMNHFEIIEDFSFSSAVTRIKKSRPEKPSATWKRFMTGTRRIENAKEKIWFRTIKALMKTFKKDLRELLLSAAEMWARHLPMRCFERIGVRKCTD